MVGPGRSRRGLLARCSVWIPPGGKGPCPVCGKDHEGWDLGHVDGDRRTTPVLNTFVVIDERRLTAKNVRARSGATLPSLVVDRYGGGGTTSLPGAVTHHQRFRSRYGFGKFLAADNVTTSGSRKRGLNMADLPKLQSDVILDELRQMHPYQWTEAIESVDRHSDPLDVIKAVLAGVSWPATTRNHRRAGRPGQAPRLRTSTASHNVGGSQKEREMTTDYRNARRELREARDVARENAETIVKEARKAHRDLEPIEAAAFKSQTRAAIEADQALRALGEPKKARPKRSVYTEDGRDSYFIDLIAASSPRPMPGHPPHQAQARLAAHRSEREKYKYIYDEIAERRVNKHGAQFRSELGEPMQYRDLSQTAGLGLEFDSPTWVLQKFVTTVLAAAPLLACSDNVPLPAKTGFEVLIPRFDTAAVAAPAPPPPQNIGLPADNTETDSLSSFVTMIPSQTTVSYQALEQGNVDTFVAAQAAESIAAEIESTLWSGLGEASGEPVGVLNSGIGAVATPGQTPILVAQGAAAAMAIVGKNRLRPATHLFGTPERWEVTFGYQDGSNNEPLTLSWSASFRRTHRRIHLEPSVHRLGRHAYRDRRRFGRHHCRCASQGAPRVHERPGAPRDA